jgi:phosphoglycolate phosphatase-like HAD superfamily hydrolase/SAM-dependent methyltransferase
MKLAIFDIDGTLTQTNDVDSDCFIQAFNSEFKTTEINTNWAVYGHTTDSGITLQIFQERFERIPTADELSKLQHRFAELLKEHERTITEVPGANLILQKLAQTQWVIAIASGGWRASAMIKLQAAGIEGNFPGAFADDGISREDIVRTAISRAKEIYRQADFEKIVCIGDGIWDVLTAIQLQLPFIGVAGDEQKIVLQNAGVENIVEDFQDFDNFLTALNRATIPKQHKPSEIQNNSLPPSYFEALYGNNPDPWQFKTSEYEAKKYTATIAALTKQQYKSGLEIGGSIGILTEKLAPLCKLLLSLEVSKLAQDQAKERCRHLPHVRFEIVRVPEEFPNEMFDLVLISEVGYYWCWQDLKKAQQHILEKLEPGGNLLLVHWTQFARDYPLNGDEVHDSFFELTPTQLRHIKGMREEQYRLDLFERV